MATNWNEILSNTNNLKDVLAILKKILALMNEKADAALINEAIAKFEDLNANFDDLLQFLKESSYLEIVSATSFAEPQITFGLHIAQREFFISTEDAHVAFSDTNQPIKVGVFKNNNLICEIDFLENTHTFNFLEDLTQFEKGDVIKLQLLNFHYSVKNIAVTLVGKFPVYTLE